MGPNNLIPFKISSIDSQGQGVSKITGQVVFIPKTSIGEEGEAEILGQRKGVVFAKLKTLHLKSPKRVTPICEHFQFCSSCHFLHMNYEEEVSIKEATLENLIRKIPHPKIEILRAPVDKRVGYRNRIQLHYNLKTKELGLFEKQSHNILPVPNCLIPSQNIREEITRLYKNSAWTQLAPKTQEQGHVELYEKSERVQISWNRPYAEGGFTQVFEEMNQNLKNELTSWVKEINPNTILDLFAGNGNLSDNLLKKQRFCVDQYEKTPKEDFYSQNLYSKDALKNVATELKKRNLTPELILMDPPRSGLKNLSEWLERLSPKYLAYVSCDPHTMTRDLSNVTNYQILKIFLIDFFPSTYHFETMVFLEKKS
jgi:23S rRNA (uracil1939-C5)-methyltransferase